MAVPPWSKDFYVRLNVSNTASQKGIQKAYRKLAMKYHPDLHLDGNKAEMEERMKLINLAFEVLGDPEKRKQYDKYISPPQPKKPQPPPKPKKPQPEAKPSPKESTSNQSDDFKTRPKSWFDDLAASSPPPPRGGRGPRSAPPQAIRRPMAKGEFFALLTVVMVVGIAFFFMLRNERIEGEKRAEDRQAEINRAWEGHEVCKGRHRGFRLVELQEAVIQGCMDKVPSSEWKKLDKSFLWSVKRNTVMLFMIGYHDEFERFEKLINQLTVEDISAEVPVRNKFRRGFGRVTLFTILAHHIELDFDKWPPGKIPYDVWVKYKVQGQSALEQVLNYGNVYEEAFHHKYWKNDIEGMKRLGAEALKISEPSFRNYFKEYFDAQLQLARKT